MNDIIKECEEEIKKEYAEIEEIALYNQEKVLNAFKEARIALNHFSSSNGYGYSDIGKNKLSEVFKYVFNAEEAVASPYITCGTHALNAGLFGCLKTGDKILSITGDVYDSLKNAVDGEDNGSLKDYGISFEKDIYFMLPYVLTMNENFLNPQKSAEFYKNLEGKYAPTASQVGSLTLAQMFLQGKIGLYLSGHWMYPKIKDSANFDWDIIPFCGTVPLDASGWAISNDSKHKEQAEKFLKYLSSKKSIEYFNSTGLIVPARSDVEIDNSAFKKSVENSKPLAYGKDYKKNADELNKELFK